MQVDAALATHAEHWPVDVEKASLLSYDTVTFGPYQASDIVVDWGSKAGVKVGMFAASGEDKKWSFSLTFDGKTYKTSCDYSGHAKGLSNGGAAVGLGESKHNVECTINGDNGWKLELADAEMGFAGKATSGERALGLNSKHVAKSGDTTSSPLGYDIRFQDGVVAEMQTTGDLQAWMSTQMEATDKPVAASLLVAMYFFDVARSQ